MKALKTVWRVLFASIVFAVCVTIGHHENAPVRIRVARDSADIDQTDIQQNNLGEIRNLNAA